MVFESNPHGTLGTIIIVSVCLVALFWGATEGAANGKSFVCYTACNPVYTFIHKRNLCRHDGRLIIIKHCSVQG